MTGFSSNIHGSFSLQGAWKSWRNCELWFGSVGDEGSGQGQVNTWKNFTFNVFFFFSFFVYLFGFSFSMLLFCLLQFEAILIFFLKTF